MKPCVTQGRSTILTTMAGLSQTTPHGVHTSPIEGGSPVESDNYVLDYKTRT